MTVLYLWPKDTAKFEKYYPTHLKIVGDHQQEIGFTKAELTKFVSSLQGTKPEFYRQAELYFPSMDALKAGIATAGFKAVGDDFKNFVAPDGLIAHDRAGDRRREQHAVPGPRHGRLRHAEGYRRVRGLLPEAPGHRHRRSRRPSGSCARTSRGSSPTSTARRRPSIARPSSASPAWSSSTPASAARHSRLSATTSATSSTGGLRGMIGVQQ